MSTEAARRFDEFCEVARAGALRAITHGGVAMRLRVAAVALSLAAGLPGAAAQAQSNLLQYAALTPSASSGSTLQAMVPFDGAKQALASLMSVRCKPATMAATVAGRNLECRSAQRIGQESSIDQLADAEMVGEVLGLPVFLSSSDRAYVHHMDSREGKTMEWIPMLVMSRGMVNSLSNLPEEERKAGMAFLLGKERAIVRGASSESADFEGFQYATFVCSDIDKAQVGVEIALNAEAPKSKGSMSAALRGRQVFVRAQFDVAREMRASMMADARERR